MTREASRGRLPGRIAALNGVDKAAIALIALQLSWRVWAAYTAFFAADDFIYLYTAEHHRLGWHYLTWTYNGHLMPAQFLIVWLLQHAAPLNWPLAATVLVVLQVAVDVAVWRLLRELFGTPPAVLLPLIVFLFSPLTMSSYLWWAAALEMLPLLLAMSVSLRAHVAYLRRGRAADAWTAVLAYAAGLLFWEKALLILPLLAGVSLLFPVTARLTDLARRHVLGRWRLWVGYAAVTAGYLVLYAAAVGWPLAGHSTAGARWRLVREMVVFTFVPGVFAAPWVNPPPAPGFMPTPPSSVLQVLTVLTVGLVVGTIWVRRGAWRAWALLAAYVALDVWLLAGGRLYLIGPVIGRDTRYIAEAVLVAALALGFAVLPLRDEPRRPPPRRLAIAGELGRPSYVALVVVCYVSSCWVATSTDVHRSQARPTKAFVTTARASLRAAGVGVVLYDGSPPKGVLTPMMFSNDRYSRLLAGAPERPRFNVPTEKMYVFDDAGRLRRVHDVGGGAAALPGPVEDCGYNVDDRGATIPLNHRVYAWNWLVRIAYFTSQRTPATVEAGGTRVPVVFEPGLHDLYLQVTRGLDHVQVSPAAGSAVVCVAGVTVGTPR